MIHELLYAITSHLPCRLIHRNPDEPYLERYYLGRLFGATFYLHRFVSSDEEKYLHNHPWTWGRALVLNGAYDEEVVTDLCPHASESGAVTETRRIRWWNRVDGNHFHRIANAKPNTWTLFFHGPRARIMLGQASKLKGWGFLEYIYAVGLHNVTIFRPFDTSNLAEWWREAPTGAESEREPV